MGGLIGQGFITFFVSAGLLHCPVAVDLHRADAVLDPRAPTTMISPALAQRLHLAPHGTVATTAYGLTAALPAAGPVTVGIHPASFRLATVAIETPEMERHAPPGAEIVLGADALAGVMLRLDVGRHRLSSISSSDAARATRGATPAALQVDEAGHLLVSIRIENDPPVLAMLDLGSDTPVTISRAFAAAHGIDVSQPGNAATGAGLDYVNNGLDIALDTAHFTPKTVRISDDSIVSIRLGAPVFEDHPIIIDLRTRKVWIVN